MILNDLLIFSYDGYMMLQSLLHPDEKIMCLFLKEERRKEVDIRIMVICYATGIVEYDIRTPELSNALLHMKQRKTPAV